MGNAEKCEDLCVYQASAHNVMTSLKKTGIAFIPNFFNKTTITELSSEVDNFFTKLEPKDQAEINNCNMHVIKNSYKAGKVLRVSSSSYSLFPKMQNLLVENTFLNSLVNLYYGNQNRKFMQIFCTHEFIPRNLEWVDGINHNAGLHFDPYQALKFVVFVTDASKENGAIRLIPGSNTEGKHFRENVLKQTTYKGEKILDCHGLFKNSKFSEDDVVYIEAPAGTLLVFDTDLWHGGGEITKKGLERKYIICHNRK